jgi:diaminobutyrate-2-oxoglutarate transaminase
MLTQPAIEEFESKVRYYSREYPTVFSRSEDALLFDNQGRRYIDFFCGAGVMNYGHNHPHLKNALLEYVQRNGIIHSLDFHTEARSEFLRQFQERILAPRGLDYKVQFTGPTGTNSVEAALKLARKVTRRSAVVAFTNAFHGVSLGSLAATATSGNRRGAGVQLDRIIRLPFDGFLGSGLDIEYVRKMLTSRGSGLDAPAAILFETVQGEGGLNPASEPFVTELFEIARQIGALVIVDEIQTGCGRVGPFFSFEHFGVVPDLVCMSKSISGLGLPMALLLMRPEHDQWEPGEHNGTFRGHNLSFVTAAAALDFWDDPAFLELARSNSEQLRERLDELCERFGSAERKGRGLFSGLELHDGEVARRVKSDAFEHGLLLETCGPNGSVIKTVPPINIASETLAEGLDVLEGALTRALPIPAWTAGGRD